MSNNKHSIIKGIVITRKYVVELVVVAILLAFSIALLAGFTLSSVESNPIVIIPVCTFLCLGSILYFAARLFIGRTRRHTYKAFLIYDVEKKQIIPVPRYYFSEAIAGYVQSAFVENPALKTLWDKEPLEKPFEEILASGQKIEDHESSKSAQLLTEAIEYFVLVRLSEHLNTYFNSESFRKENLKQYGRHDVPELLLTNRFLELFSRPMEDREPFVDETLGRKRTQMTVSVHLPEGFLYERFRLVLPKQSLVRRPHRTRIEIETRKLNLIMVVRFEGFSTILPHDFEENYMGITPTNWILTIKPYLVNIDIDVSIKLRALLSRAGWEYYHWVDSFLDEIEDKVSTDAFFKRINWASALTVIQWLKRSQKSETENKS